MGMQESSEKDYSRFQCFFQENKSWDGLDHDPVTYMGNGDSQDEVTRGAEPGGAAVGRSAKSSSRRGTKVSASEARTCCLLYVLLLQALGPLSPSWNGPLGPYIVIF